MRRRPLVCTNELATKVCRSGTKSAVLPANMFLFFFTESFVVGILSRECCVMET